MRNQYFPLFPINFFRQGFVLQPRRLNPRAICSDCQEFCLSWSSSSASPCYCMPAEYTHPSIEFSWHNAWRDRVRPRITRFAQELSESLGRASGDTIICVCVNNTITSCSSVCFPPLPHPMVLHRAVRMHSYDVQNYFQSSKVTGWRGKQVYLDNLQYSCNACESSYRSCKLDKSMGLAW